MNLIISSADPFLARTLLLEAKRLSLDAAADISLLLLDLDHPNPTVTPPTGAMCVGFTAAPDALSPKARAGLSALLSLPFSVKEFDHAMARLLPRLPESLLICGTGELLLRGKRIHLSPREAALFALLYENRDRAVSEAEVAAALGESAAISNTPAVYLYRLRKKLSADGVLRIRTLRQKGVQWVGETALTV